MFNAKAQIMSNGIKIVTIKKNTELMSIQIGIKIGSLYEKKKLKGISHFIEHMIFKGTKNRNNKDLNEDLENLGGDYNAYTDYDCTVYSVTALADELAKSVELLGDMLQHSIFPKEELEKERGVILSEIRTSKDDIEDYSFKKINSVAFNKSPLKYDTIGEDATVKNFSQADLIEFYDKYYVPNNCYISIVSPYEHEEVVALVEKYFGEWIWKEYKKEKIITERNNSIIVNSHKNDIEQSTILYLYTFYGLSKDEELALKVLNHRFGESSNSILFRALREERGLAYDVYTHMDVTNFVKTLYIYTAVGEENIEEATNIIDGCIRKLINKEIIFDENTMNLMKKILKTAVISTLEDCTDLCNYVLHQSLDGDDIYQFFEDMKKIQNIKAEDVYKVAEKVLNNPTIHILTSS